jgi:hypothetical protein
MVVLGVEQVVQRLLIPLPVLLYLVVVEAVVALMLRSRLARLPEEHLFMAVEVVVAQLTRLMVVLAGYLPLAVMALMAVLMQITHQQAHYPVVAQEAQKLALLALVAVGEYDLLIGKR